MTKPMKPIITSSKTKRTVIFCCHDCVYVNMKLFHRLYGSLTKVDDLITFQNSKSYTSFDPNRSALRGLLVRETQRNHHFYA